MATGLQYQQWKRDAKTLAPLPYLLSTSTVKMIFCSHIFLSSSTKYHRGDLIYIGTHAMDFGRCEEDYVDLLNEHIYVCCL